jgi:hypothetical protein
MWITWMRIRIQIRILIFICCGSGFLFDADADPDPQPWFLISFVSTVVVPTMVVIVKRILSDKRMGE